MGGLYETGCWHARLTPIIYPSSSRALCLLEVLVHLELTIDQLPDHYVYQVNDIPDDVERLLPRDLEPVEDKAHATADFGIRWLDEQRSLALIAPSGNVPREPNIMLNPRHPAIGDASFSTETDVIWDARLLHM